MAPSMTQTALQTSADLLHRKRARPAERAGRHIVTAVPIADPQETVGAVVGRLAGHDFDAADVVYVVDKERILVGAIRLEELLAAPSGALASEHMNPRYPRAGSLRDQEHVAAEAVRCGTTSVAVVDDQGRFAGAVPARSLLAILRHEHVEDLHRLTGIQRETDQVLSALESPPLRRARHRLPWLLVGLAGSMLAAAVMARFERVLQGTMAVAFFVPAIVYLADAIGTQTEAIVVRGLSLSRLPLRHLLVDELRTGLLIGIIMGAIAFPLVVWTFGDARLAASVAAAIFAAGGVATTIGLLLPWLLQRLGSDPAFGSGPVATIIQDVLSLLIYFAIATLCMG